jgi:DNA-binding response OmpR family regulator
MAPRIALCIDPDAGTVAQLRRVLEPAGFRVESIPNGDDAFEWGLANKPSLVILCVEPRKVGYAISNKLRRTPGLREVPLVLTSAEETLETFEQHKKLKSRADAYMTKPLDERLLLQNVSRLVDVPPEAALAPVPEIAPGIGFLASSDGVVTPVERQYKPAVILEVNPEARRYLWEKVERLPKVEPMNIEPVLEFKPFDFPDLAAGSPLVRPTRPPPVPWADLESPLPRFRPPAPPPSPPAPSGGWLKQVGFVLLGLLASLIGC